MHKANFKLSNRKVPVRNGKINDGQAEDVNETDPKESENVHKKIDPDDGKEYTWETLHQKYNGRYNVHQT